jgi:hypothetical protein
LGLRLGLLRLGPLGLRLRLGLGLVNGRLGDCSGNWRSTYSNRAGYIYISARIDISNRIGTRINLRTRIWID